MVACWMKMAMGMWIFRGQSPVISRQSSDGRIPDRIVGADQRVRPMSRIHLFCLLIFCFTACVPAIVPPQLTYTPGPTVRLSDLVYESAQFRVRYPPGWRVITSAASSTATVIFAAAEGDALIMVGADLTEAPQPAGYDGPIRSERREITLANGLTIVAILNAPPEKWASYAPLWEDAVASITGAE